MSTPWGLFKRLARNLTFRISSDVMRVMELYYLAKTKQNKTVFSVGMVFHYTVAFVPEISVSCMKDRASSVRAIWRHTEMLFLLGSCSTVSLPKDSECVYTEYLGKLKIIRRQHFPFEDNCLMEEPNGYSALFCSHSACSAIFSHSPDRNIITASALNSSRLLVMASLFFREEFRLAYMSPSFGLLQCRTHL